MIPVAKVAGPVRCVARCIHQTSSRSQAVHYDGPLFPSVHRLLLKYASSIKNPSEIKGTGIRGMITKGDVLAYLGKASGPLGTYAGKEPKPETATASKGASAAKSEVVNPMDGPALRQLIVTNLLQASLKARNAPGLTASPTFDSIIEDYNVHPTKPAPSTLIPPPLVTKKSAEDAYLDGLY